MNDQDHPNPGSRAFKVGDVVVLNSGGPDMTVVSESVKKNEQHLACLWFPDQRAPFKASFVKVPAKAVRGTNTGSPAGS